MDPKSDVDVDTQAHVPALSTPVRCAEDEIGQHFSRIKDMLDAEQAFMIKMTREELDRCKQAARSEALASLPR